MDFQENMKLGAAESASRPIWVEEDCASWPVSSRRWPKPIIERAGHCGHPGFQRNQQQPGGGVQTDGAGGGNLQRSVTA